MSRNTPQSTVEIEDGEYRAVLHVFTVVVGTNGSCVGDKFRLCGLWSPASAIDEVQRCFGITPSSVTRVYHDTYVEGALADWRSNSGSLS